jgi:hypothetical protein
MPYFGVNVKKRVLLLVDGDMVAFSHCAAEEYGKEPEDVSFAKIQMSIDSKMKFLTERLGATEVITFLSGSDNLRFDISADYKANRDGVWRPENLKNAKAYLQVAWNGYSFPYLEADDLMAMFCRHEYEMVCGKRNVIKELIHKGPATYDEIVVASLDKDLRQVGRLVPTGPKIVHYQWERESQGIGEKRTVVEGYGELHCIVKQSGKTKKKEIKGVGPKFFLWQMLTGDGTDGVIGCGVREERMYKTGAKSGEMYMKRDGVGAVAAFEILDKTTTYAEGLKAVIAQYIMRFADGWEEELLKTGRLVYMNHMVDDGHLVRLWHYKGVTDRYDLKEHRIIPEAEYLQKNF